MLLFFISYLTILYPAEFSEDFASVPHAADLLCAFSTQSDFGKGHPSEDVLAFISRIESADPNSEQFDEDNSNSSWGHYQFTAGGMTFTKILTRWDDVGNVDTACKLLAATIRTCKVAHHVCFQRSIKATSFLSDAYLANIVERLWELWKTGGGQVSYFDIYTELHHIHNASLYQYPNPRAKERPPRFQVSTHHRHHQPLP